MSAAAWISIGSVLFLSLTAVVGFFLKQFFLRIDKLIDGLSKKLDKSIMTLTSLDKSVALIQKDLVFFRKELDEFSDFKKSTSGEIFEIRQKIHQHGNEINSMNLKVIECKECHSV